MRILAQYYLRNLRETKKKQLCVCVCVCVWRGRREVELKIDHQTYSL